MEETQRFASQLHKAHVEKVQFESRVRELKLKVETLQHKNSDNNKRMGAYELEKNNWRLEKGRGEDSLNKAHRKIAELQGNNQQLEKRERLLNEETKKQTSSLIEKVAEVEQLKGELLSKNNLLKAKDKALRKAQHCE